MLLIWQNIAIYYPLQLQQTIDTKFTYSDCFEINCGSWVHEVLNKGKKRRPSKKGNHKKCRRGNIILFVGPRQEERREYKAQEGWGNGYPMQWICDNAKKSWTECLTFIKSNHANEKENGGEALRKVLTFDYVLVWCAFTTHLTELNKKTQEINSIHEIAYLMAQMEQRTRRGTTAMQTKIGISTWFRDAERGLNEIMAHHLDLGYVNDLLVVEGLSQD